MSAPNAGTKVVIVLAALALCATPLIGQNTKSAAPQRTDWTEPSPAAQTQTEYVIVTFTQPPAASYRGGIPGFAATNPARRSKLNPAAPAVMAYRKYLGDIHQSFRSYMAANAPRAQVVRDFTLVANALAVRLNGTRLATLAAGPGVKSVEFSALYRPTMNVSAPLIGAPTLWGANRATAGSGIKVGIIDSGIDDTHPFFACKGPINHKVFASGVAGNPNNVLVSEHGTHVSGTVAGCLINLSSGPITGPISGLAPGATLFDYNVFPGFGAGFIAFGGSALSLDIIEALEAAIRDGVDVVNMSLGGGVEGPHDILADAVNATVDAGLVVAVAAGNSGPGDSTVESPGSAANALTAGASTNPHFIGINVTPDVASPPTFGAAPGEFANFDPAITAAYAATSPQNGCTAITTNLTGKIAVINRGVCTFSTKIRNAQNAGALGVLMVNNVAGDPVAMGQDGTANQPTIPAAMLSRTDGPALLTLAAPAVTVDGTNPHEFVTANADIIAGFSSRGPTPFTSLIKPDATAPGVNVYSSVFHGEFAMFQGTSMATPHLSGSAALLLASHPGWSPEDVKSAIVNTAKRPVTDSATGTVDAGQRARGGGRVNLTAATATPLTFSPVSASFGTWTGNVTVAATQDITVFNVSGSAQNCTVSKTGPSILTVPGTIAVGPGTSTSLTLELNAGKANQTPGNADYSGDVVVQCGATQLRVPWFVRILRLAKP